MTSQDYTTASPENPKPLLNLDAPGRNGSHQNAHFSLGAQPPQGGFAVVAAILIGRPTPRREEYPERK